MTINNVITINELCKKYNKSSNYFRILLCRPEFNQFRVDQNDRKFYVFKDCENFHKMLKFIMNLKTKKYIIIFALLLNIQIAWGQHYEPIIIYSPSGEPQTIIKGKIIYDNYGVPKSYIQTKTSMSSVRKK